MRPDIITNKNDGIEESAKFSKPSTEEVPTKVRHGLINLAGELSEKEAMELEEQETVLREQTDLRKEINEYDKSGPSSTQAAEELKQAEELEKKEIDYLNRVAELAKNMDDPALIAQRIVNLARVSSTPYLTREALEEAQRQELTAAKDKPNYEEISEKIEKKYEAISETIGISSDKEKLYIGQVTGEREKSQEDIKIELEKNIESLANDFCNLLGKETLPQKRLENIFSAGDAIDQIEELLEMLGGLKKIKNMDYPIREKIFKDIMAVLNKAEAQESIDAFRAAGGQLDLLSEEQREEILRKDQEVEKKYNNARKHFFKNLGIEEGGKYQIKKNQNLSQK